MGFFALNYWAVLAAAAANFVIGALWYGPVFGAYWRTLIGFTTEDMRSMPLTATQAMVGGAIASLAMAFVIAQLIFGLGVVDLADGALLAFWLWLGLTAPTYAGGWLWEGKPVKLFLLNAAYSLVALIVMTLILA